MINHTLWPSELMAEIADSILMHLNQDLGASGKTHPEIKTEIVAIIAKEILDNNFILFQSRE